MYFLRMWLYIIAIKYFTLETQTQFTLVILHFIQIIFLENSTLVKPVSS